MSARKRKKRSVESAATEAVTATDAAELVEESPARAESSSAESIEAADAEPAVSRITELRPREPEEEVDLATLADSEDAAVSGEDSDPADADADEEPAVAKSRAHLKRVLESLIFVSDQIISVQQLGRIVKAKQAEVRELLAELSIDYEGRGIELVEVAGGYQFRSAAACAPFVRDLVAQRPVRLTRAQLETLALIAYRQPITRPEIDDVRGVDSGSAIKVLCERDLVKILGRKDEAGRPLLYGTTPFFLEFFGMGSMKDLPTLREFTELTDEHRELFQRKTGEIPDLSTEPAPSIERHTEENGETGLEEADTQDDAAEAVVSEVSDEPAELIEHRASSGDETAAEFADAEASAANADMDAAADEATDEHTTVPESDSSTPQEDEPDALA